MTLEQGIVTGLSILCLMFAWCAFFYLRRYEKIKEANAKLTQEYFNDLLKAREDKTTMRTRVRELENSIQETFSVKIRNDVTKIDCIFTKVEMAFLMAGTHKLINSDDSTIDDKEWYIKLYKKIQEHIDQMEEEEPE